MPGELAFATDPISTFGFVFVPTPGTPARCASFRTGEALYVGGLALMSEVVDVLAIFPASHALIVVSAFVLIADSMRVANEEGSHLVLDTEVDDFARGFVPQVTNAPFSTTALLIFGSLKSLPTPGILFATSLLLRNLTQLLASLTFERADTATGDDHGLACVRRDSCQVNFAEIYGGLHRAGSLLGLWDFYTHMQFKAVVPDQAASTTVFWKVDRQNKRSTASSPRQHHAPTLFGDRLSRPLDWVKAFGAPGILHLHLRMCLTELVRCLYVGKECADDHLYRLAM